MFSVSHRATGHLSDGTGWVVSQPNNDTTTSLGLRGVLQGFGKMISPSKPLSASGCEHLEQLNKLILCYIRYQKVSIKTKVQIKLSPSGLEKNRKSNPTRSHVGRG